MTLDNKKIEEALESNDQVVLFLDYDGTLADFTKHPDIIEPNSEVIELVEALIKCGNITTAIISGRRLTHIQKLLPLENILLAGTYGLEIQLPGDKIFHPIDYSKIRPDLEKLKPQWQSLIDGKSSFFLEDKGWTLAIHARYAEEKIAGDVLSAAEQLARKIVAPALFQVKAGHKFLEVSPKKANKGNCAKYLISMIPIEGKTMIYMGDDDKDEEAFAVVQSQGGFAIRVCSNVINNPIEDWRLEDPKAARRLLWEIVDEIC
jgi:trehalose 6-phosphate phosphatase